jgi:L-rhamnose-H+ transport protein
MHAEVGFMLVVLAGIATGSYFLGLKYVAPWKWENIWLVYATLALVGMPVAMAFATVPRLGEVFRLIPARTLWLVFIFGVGWGIGSVLSGLGVARMGLALGVSVLIGVDAAVGTFVPMVVNTPDIIFTKRGLLVIAAVMTLAGGVTLVGLAGKKRELAHGQNTEDRANFTAGVVICVLSGAFSAMMNFAFAFSQPISESALSVGATESNALNAVWLVTLIGGFLPTGIYTAYLLTRNRTWGYYLLPGTRAFWFVGFGMALLWYLGVILYGWGAAAAGRFGAVIAWPLFMGVLILASSVAGFATGEWKGAGTQAKQWMGVGLALLMAASVLLGFANNL